MPSAYSAKLGVLTLSLTLLAVLSFNTQSSEPMTKRVIQIHLEMYDDKATIQERCDVKEGDVAVNGCSWKLGNGRHKVVVMKPNDFCDWNRLRTLGHETLHAAGFNHSEAYRFHAGDDNVSWSGSNCEMTR